VKHIATATMGYISLAYWGILVAFFSIWKLEMIRSVRNVIKNIIRKNFDMEKLHKHIEPLGQYKKKNILDYIRYIMIYIIIYHSLEVIFRIIYYPQEHNSIIFYSFILAGVGIPGYFSVLILQIVINDIVKEYQKQSSETGLDNISTN
jgi:Na+/glutamate symporter